MRKGVGIGLAVVMVFGGGLITGLLLRGGGPRPSPPLSSPSEGSQEAAVRVPDVAGLGLAAAADVLASLGLRIDSESLRARPSSFQAGAIVSEEPAAGSFLTVGESMVHALSSGPHPDLVNGRVGVGGTCELVEPRPPLCVGGPLLVPLERA